jgi:hypothetical protein
MIDLKINLEVTELEPDTYHLVFGCQRDLAHSMMRLQEHYEGPDPKIRDQYFTLEEFLQAYTLPSGVFDYTEKWCGFNVPGHVVERWHELFVAQGQLSIKEQQMMDTLLCQRSGKFGKWYMIATASGGDSNTIKHELAHSRYYLYDDYKASCDQLIDCMSAADRRRMTKVLIKMGYAETVINDEIQAYLSTGTKAMNLEMFGVFSEKSQPSIKELRALFRKWQP